MAPRVVVGVSMAPLKLETQVVMLIGGAVLVFLIFVLCMDHAAQSTPASVAAREVHEHPRLCAQTCREFGALHWQVNINTRECTCSGDVRTDPPER